MNYLDNFNIVLNEFLVKHKKEDFKINTYKKKEMMIFENDPLDHLEIVLDGRLRITRDYENGKRLLIKTTRGFTLLGDVEFITDRNATCNVEAFDEVTTIKISYKEINELYSDSATFYQFLVKHVSNKLLTSDIQKSHRLVYQVEARVASFLLSMRDKDNRIVISLKDIAETVGTSYRHLQRVMNELKDNNIIKRDNMTITILKVEELKTMSGGNIYEE